MTVTVTDISDAVLADNPEYIIMSATGFYKYLELHYNPFRLNTVLCYLEDTFGYMMGREKINDRARTGLYCIFDYYTDKVMKPQWDAKKATEDTQS